MSINCATRASILVLLQWISAAALAQQAPVSDSRSGQLEEIVVTAQKREQNLQVVPIAITALDGADIKSSGISDSYDLKTVHTGLSRLRHLGFVRPRIIRSRHVGRWAGMKILLSMYDGVMHVSCGLACSTTSRKLKPFKGPRNTVGRNADYIGWLINVITADPSHTFNNRRKYRIRQL